MQTKPTRLTISVKKQRLKVKRGRRTLRTYPVSTSVFGLGTEEGSQKTPTGRFVIGEKIGGDAPLGTVFRSRKPAGQMTPGSGEDQVVSRILWLEGRDLANANTHERYIYIHGTNHENRIGQPASHGCIRMRNADVADLFELVNTGTHVQICR